MSKKKIESNVLDVIKFRRSVREFSSRPIEKEKMDTIMEAARLAPSSCNTQPWEFVVVDNRDALIKVAKAQPPGTPINKFLVDAVAIIVCVDNPRIVIHKAAGALNRNNQRLDMGLAVEHMVLVAAELGIGSCWIGWFSEKKIKEILNIPKKKTVSVLLALGYPKNASDGNSIGAIPARPRKETSEIVFYNRYGKNERD